MNMIIADDGSNNIRCADTLNEKQMIPRYQSHDGAWHSDGKAHLILTNPPFGTSESESLLPESAEAYAVQSTRGQSLFIQKMVEAAHDDSLIVTVIDEGVLNTSSYEVLRRHVLKNCRVEMVLQLPSETFKPNKINVRSSVLVLRKRAEPDENSTDDYPVIFTIVDSLGYDGSGEDVRGFDLDKLIKEVAGLSARRVGRDGVGSGYNWSAFRVQSTDILQSKTARLDARYWHPDVRGEVDVLAKRSGTRSIRDLNKIQTKRGKSPPAAEYVSESEGYAIVVKAGSNISKTGELIATGDFIERPLYEDYAKKGLALQDGDVLLASTGDGTLGKCCVYRNYDAEGKTRPGVPEGHVTVIRLDTKQVHPEYVCDYLRKGFGSEQVARLFTGSTGMVEIAPAEVDAILIPALPDIGEQKRLSKQLRKSERDAAEAVERSSHILTEGEAIFRAATLGAAEA
jgi:type I restriction enzyme M protein